MHSTDLRARTRIALIVTGLLAAMGGLLAVVAPASAATVSSIRYSSEFAEGFTTSVSPDGCTLNYTGAGAGTSWGESTMYYYVASVNECTGDFYSLYGQAPTQVFTFDRKLVHAVATVPLSDGTQIHLDLTWTGAGTVERGGSTSRDILPGDFVWRSTVRGTLQEAVVTGTLSFENAYIAASKGSSMTVTIEPR